MCMDGNGCTCWQAEILSLIADGAWRRKSTNNNRYSLIIYVYLFMRVISNRCLILLFFVVQFVHIKPAQSLQMHYKMYKVSTVTMAILQLLKNGFTPFWFVFNRTLPNGCQQKRLVCPEPRASITPTSKCKVVFSVTCGPQFECNGTSKVVCSSIKRKSAQV